MAKRAAAKKSTASKSRGNSSAAFSAKPIVLGAFLLVFGLAGGYAWRSFAPLPIFEGTRLSASTGSDKKVLSSEEKKVQKLEKELEEIEQIKAEKETELGETQIKAILNDS